MSEWIASDHVEEFGFSPGRPIAASLQHEHQQRATPPEWQYAHHRGAPGRLLEVTTDRRIVSGYIYPVFSGANATNGVYRGYRVPYGWIPPLARPAEPAVVSPPIGSFRAP